MDKAYKSLLERQGYRFTGEHSSIKICEWTKKSLTGKGVCYKQKFYGIKSHQCCQCSVVTNFCDLDCIYCWRKRNNSPFGKIDDPKQVIENSIKAQRKLLEGYYGNAKADKQLLDEAKNPTNFAISLTGEMLYYPLLSEFLKELHDRGCWSFLVTNGMVPEAMHNLNPM
ncbi:4-demethylwyosine synthase TYW1, partial [Candidatus Woesearchaeota archaeon]|nr:4-demethylwyosine synthase TYW1 [Candidatus Woesearchaeota archaeon]